MARDLSSDRRRARKGRLPYSFVGIVVLAAMVILTAYFELAITWSNNQGAYNVPEQTHAALLSVQQDIQAAAHLDLMRAEASLLLQGTNPPLDQLNASVGALFDLSLAHLNLTTAEGFVDGTVTVRALAWGINVTWDQGQVQDAIPQVSLRPDLNDPNLPLAAAPDAARSSGLALTEAPVYPMAIGFVDLVAVDAASGVSEVMTVPFSETVQSELGLLEDSSAQFTDAASGPQGEFAHLVQYLATTLGELRALSGYGSGGWPGPQATTQIADPLCTPVGPSTPTSILSCDDVHDAVSLATLLASLQYFRSYDPNATYAFLSGLGPGPYQTLLSRYVYDGVVDGAALLLLLLGPNPGGWSDGTIASGAGLASAVYSFSDRFEFDLFQKFFGAQVVDPTLTEPVVNWATIAAQGQAYARARLVQWLHDFQYWLGITIQSIPHSDDTAFIPAESTTVGGCTYVIFPGGHIEVSNTYVPDVVNLVLGATGGTFPPQLFNVFENVSVTDPYAGANWQDLNELAGYYLVDRSLEGEYAANPILPPPVPPGGYDMSAFFQILQSLNASMSHKSPTATQILQKGLLDYIAYEADKDGANFTLAAGGLPDLTTLAGVALALNSTSYNLLENGSNAIFAGPFALALQKFATQASNGTWDNASWIWGAAHPNLQAADPPRPDGVNWWTVTDIARVTARLWFQAMYMLWYGSSGVIPTSPVGPIDYGLMDAAQYNVQSPGVQHNPPPPFHEPDFAINVQNETYISVMDWMGWRVGGTECGGGFGRCGDAATFNNGAYSNCAGGSPGEVAAYNAAYAYWYGEEGTGRTSHTWNNVAGAVTCALLGPSTPSCAGTTTGTPQGLDAIHYDTAPGIGLGQSWWNVKNNTGDAYWGCGYAGVCPAYDNGNFTTWIINTIAQPILNDTRTMGRSGGWLPQLYASANRAIWAGANQSATVAKPWLENQVPYTFWQGNYSNELTDQQLFNESLRNLTAGMTLRGSGLTFSWAPPAQTIHLVDAQDQASNMGLAPMESTWTIALHGALSLRMIADRAALSVNGYLYPTDLNVTLPVNVDVAVTIYTPWNLGRAWDPLPTPLPGDPSFLLTRGLFGLVGNDRHPGPNFAPGTYISHPLNALFSQIVSVGKVVQGEARDQADLLAALPDRGVGVSAPWAQNLTLLENTTNTALAATAGTYLTNIQGTLAAIAALLGAVPSGGPYTNVPWGAPAFYGYAGQLNLRASQFNYYGYPLAPYCAGTPCFGTPMQTNLTFAGTRVGVASYADNDFNAWPFLQGFTTAWSGGGGGGYALNAYWQDFGTTYQLRLNGGSTFSPPAATTSSAPYPSLAVPYLAPTAAYPVELSVCAVGALPAAAATAFGQAVSGYLPSPGVFPNYVTEQQFAAGYLYDALPGATTRGVTSFGYATDVEWSQAAGMARDANFSVSRQDASGTGLFAAPSSTGGIGAFLMWYELNHEALAYGLGALSADPLVLSTASPYLLADTYRNLTFASGALGTPSTYAFLSANLAFTEADLGGTGGGLANTPTLLIGGGTPGTWAMGGALVVG